MTPNPYLHVDDVMRAVRRGLQDWAAGLLQRAGLGGGVSGVLPDPARGLAGGPHLVLLPYQTVLESSSGVPTMTLVPLARDAKRDSVPPAWQTVARGMTTVLLEQYPQRDKRSPGLGPLHPTPPLDLLPAPIAAWYRENPAWKVGEDRGKLPQVSWRQPFPMVVRFAALGMDTAGETPDLDDFRLRALAVLAAGIRIERFVGVELPAPPVPDDLGSLVEAFAASATGEVGEALEAAAAAIREPSHTAIGLTPHHELTDNDTALMMQALRQPMQPVIVFAIRLALGAGPELLPGAIPHLDNVESVRG